MPVRPDPHELEQALGNALPGWRLVCGPEPFTWAPHMHFRARLANQDQTAHVVVRQAWREKDHEVEVFLYRSILPRLSVRTPRLLAAFEIPTDGSHWTVLEDLGDRTAQPDRSEDRRAFLRALGSLHGQGLSLLCGNRLQGGPLPRFDGKHIRYGAKRVPVDTWRELLSRGVGTPPCWLEPWVLDLPQRLLLELARRPATLLHGDADLSNGIVTDEGMALVDFERASIGPASLDIGRVAALTESAEELEDYRRGFLEAGGPAISSDTVVDWAELGLAYDSLYWVCYYIEQTTGGRDLPQSWCKDYYEPSRERLDEFHERKRGLFDSTR